MKARIALDDKQRLGLLKDREVRDINQELKHLKSVLDDLFGKPIVVANTDVFGIRDVSIGRVKR